MKYKNLYLQILILEGCKNKKLLMDKNTIRKEIRIVCDMVNMKRISTPINLIYNKPKANWSSGISFLQPIAESHIVVETSKLGFVNFEIVSCKWFEKDKITLYLSGLFQPKRIKEHWKHMKIRL